MLSRAELPLPLLVLGIRTNYIDAAFSPNHLAVGTNSFNACTDFHV
jgi:hypothetical protein